MTDLIPLLALVIGGLNLAFILKIVFNDLHDLRALLERHLDFSEALHREQERRLSALESQPHADK